MSIILILANDKRNITVYFEILLEHTRLRRTTLSANSSILTCIINTLALIIAITIAYVVPIIINLIPMAATVVTMIVPIRPHLLCACFQRWRRRGRGRGRQESLLVVAAVVTEGCAYALGEGAGELAHQDPQPSHPTRDVLLCERKAKFIAESRAIVCEDVVAGPRKLSLEACEDGIDLRTHVRTEADCDALAEHSPLHNPGLHGIHAGPTVIAVPKGPFC